MRPKMQRNISRRAALQVGGAALAASPFVPVLEVQGQADNTKRVIFFSSHNGTVINEFFPDDVGDDFELNRILAPLNAYKDRMSIVGGTELIPHPGGAHRAHGKVLTNKKSDNQDDRDAKGPSVDHVIAQRIGGDTPMRSLHLGIRNLGRGGIFWRGANDIIPAEEDPRRSFESVFGNGDPIEMEGIRIHRQSVIDRVNADFTNLRASLGTADQQILDQHLTSVRELERSLQASVVSCDVEPDDMGGFSIDNDADMPIVAALQNQVAHTALACNVTRVATYQFGRVVGKETYPFLGANELHHTISHEADAASVEHMTNINTWYMEQIADFVDRLEATPEGGGTMLDNTLVVYVNCLADHDRHGKENMPIWTIGGNWYFQGGRYSRFQESIGHYLVNLCHAMGLDDVTTFGDEDTSQGPFPDLTI